MPVITPNLGLTEPDFGSTSWNTPLNNNFGIIDTAIGGVTTLNLTAVASPQTFTTAQYQSFIIDFSGALTGAFIYNIPTSVGGRWIIRNNCSGAFTLSIGYNGQTLVIPSGGLPYLIFVDTTLSPYLYFVQSSPSITTTVSGTVDAITTISSPVTTGSYIVNESVVWKSSGANTLTNPTLNKDGRGAVVIVKGSALIALAAGDTGASGYECQAFHNGTNWVLTNPAGLADKNLSNNFTKAINFAKGASVASAATMDIWTPGDGNTIHGTGTATVTSFGTAPQAGADRWMIADAAFVLMNNANIKVQGAANYTAAVDDVFHIIADTTTVAYVEIFKANGQSLAASSIYTLITTLSTPSGSTISYTGIPGTYRELYLEYNSVVISSSGSMAIAASGNNVNYGTAITISNSPSTSMTGSHRISNVQSLLQYGPTIQGTITDFISLAITSVNTGIPKNATGGTSKISALQFVIVGGPTFTGGSISIYGIL